MIVKRLLILVLLLSLLPIPAQGAQAQTEEELIRQILIYYSHHQEAAETDIHHLLEQLESLNPETAADMRHILETWALVSDPQVPYANTVPDDLPRDDSLCIIVMGYQLDWGGGMQQELIQRLEVALDAAQAYPNAYILCTGGGTAPGSSATEAGQMVRWLQDRGIAQERLIRESRSVSTEENALYSLQILQESFPQVDSIVLISSNYHLRRCHLLFDAVLRLSDQEDSCRILGLAGCEAEFRGYGEGCFEEAENLGKILNLNVKNTRAPALSILTKIVTEGPTGYTVGESLSLTVTARYDSGYARDVTCHAEFIGFDSENPGTRQVLVRYTENGVTAEAQVEVCVEPTPTTVPPTTVPAETESFPVTGAPVAYPPQEESDSIPLPLVWTSAILLVLTGIFLLFPRYPGKYVKGRK